MAVLQSIDDAREERVGRDGVTAAAYADALARSADALAWIRARHADGKLPLLRLPERTDDLAGISDAAGRLLAGAGDIVFLGTGGSSLGGQTVAQLAGCGVPGARRIARRPAPALHGQSRSRHLCGDAGAAAARRHALRRHIEIGWHWRDADADRRGLGGGARRRPRRTDARAVLRHHRARGSQAGATACAIFSAATASRCSITTPMSAAASRC